MLKSASELNQLKQKLEESKKLEEIEKEENKKSWSVKIARDLLDDAKIFINEYLPAILEKEVLKGYVIIDINDLHDRMAVKDLPRRLSYHATEKTLFDPNTEHCQIILQNLKDLGYAASVITNECQNTTREDYGDGEYNIVNAPGTHFTHKLKITW